MNHGPENSTRNLAAATATLSQMDPVVSVNSGKRGRKDNDIRKVNKKKHALSQEAKKSKRMKEVKEELGNMGEELKLFNAASSNLQSKFIEIRMMLQKIACQEELIVDILDAIEEHYFFKI